MRACMARKSARARCWACRGRVLASSQCANTCIARCAHGVKRGSSACAAACCPWAAQRWRTASHRVRSCGSLAAVAVCRSATWWAASSAQASGIGAFVSIGQPWCGRGRAWALSSDPRKMLFAFLACQCSSRLGSFSSLTLNPQGCACVVTLSK